MATFATVSFLTFLSFIVIKFWKTISKTLYYRIRIRRLPTIPRIAYPLIGHAYLLPRDTAEFFRFMASESLNFIKDSNLKFWVGWISSVPVVCVVHPDAAEIILHGSRHIQKSFLYTFLHPWLGTGLLTAGGEKWQQRRRLITPTFHFNILQDFLSVMNEQTLRMLKRLKLKRASSANVDLGKAVTLCALDTICQTAMGQNVDAQGNEDSEYVKSIYRMSEIIQLRQKTPYYWWDFAFKKLKLGKEHKHHLHVLKSFTANVIKERMTKKDEANISRRMAFLDVLIHAKTEDGDSLSLSDIQEEVDTFMFEGHDTTAAAMTWCLYLLGRHPEIQRRVHDEIDEVLPGDCQPDMEDLKSLQYLEQVIKEALRLYPSVPLFARVTTEDCMVEGYTIPKNTEVMLQVYNIHRNPMVWENPTQFDPDRFTKENSVGRHPYAYIPFSAGPRNCIGQKFALMEEKVILSQLLRTYRVRCNTEEEDLKMIGDLILRPLEPLQFDLETR